MIRVHSMNLSLLLVVLVFTAAHAARTLKQEPAAADVAAMPLPAAEGGLRVGNPQKLQATGERDVGCIREL